MAVTGFVVICAASIVSLFGMMGETFFCEVLPNLGTEGSQAKIEDSVSSYQEGIFHRYFKCLKYDARDQPDRLKFVSLEGVA